MDKPDFALALGTLADLVRVEPSHCVEVHGFVPGQFEIATDADPLARVIDVGEPKRHFGRKCEIVEAGFPPVGVRACALGRDCQVEALALRELPGEPRRKSGSLAPVHRNAAKPAEYAAEGPAEPVSYTHLTLPTIYSV